MFETLEIGADLIANRQRAFRSFDKPVNVLETVATGDLQPVENAENQQRGETLRRRRRIVMTAPLQMQGERITRDSAVGGEIFARQQRADALEIGRHLAPDIAAIEIVEASAGKLVERIGEFRRAPDCPASGNLPSTRNRSANPGACFSISNSNGLPCASERDCA